MRKNNDFTRREFIGLVGGATAALLVPGSARGEFELAPAELEAWKKTVRTATEPRRYFSDIHTDARMHLGGIGTGNFEIGADGQLTSWQLCNTLREGQFPFFFAVKLGDSMKLLQTAGGPDWPHVARIEMTGEYPCATLRFLDDTLPVKLELEAFTPWKPLDSAASAWPVAYFTFRAHNPTSQPQTISLATFFANPIGYSGIGDFENGMNPSLGGNFNEPFVEGNAQGFYLRAKAGEEATLDKPVDLYMLKDWFREEPDPNSGQTNYAYVPPEELRIPPFDRPKNLTVRILDARNPGEIEEPSRSVIWLNEAPEDLPAEFLRWTKTVVERGATLVFSGKEQPLLKAYAAATDGKPLPQTQASEDIVFDDFENGYGKWTIEGTAFGTEPPHGTLPNQQEVSGFQGKALVNSFVNGDDAMGKLTSQPFKIDRRFIRFLVGGGSLKATQIRLLIGGNIVRTASGKDTERLDVAIWDVREFANKTAHIEIIDEAKGGWGHINADDFVFSDFSRDRQTLVALEALLPENFSAATADRLTKYLGAGHVVIISGEILDSNHTDATSVRQQAYAELCASVGARYQRTQGQSARSPGFGEMAVAAVGGEVSGWTGPGGWEQTFQPLRAVAPSAPGANAQTYKSGLASKITIPPGQTIETPFVLCWRFPNKYNSDGEWMGCHYATRWPDIQAITRDAIPNYENARHDLELFRNSFYDASLPPWLLEALTANAATVRHVGVLFHIANGDVYAWEGSNGSCQPTCTHVWGYEQTMARLFPDLEREMRRIDFTHQQDEQGGVHNRTDVPSPPHPTGERPFSDGHASCILKAYREALNSKDESFFKEYWPRVKRAVEYLIDRDAQANGGQPMGIQQDDQFNTYDEALHGVTTFISGYYLAALRAGEEWARRIGDSATADRFREIFLRGQAKLIELCWNGEYFQQHLPDYMQRDGEVGPGCMSDQLIGQWWAHQLDLGYILPREMVVSALRSIYKYNFKTDLTGWKHMPRAYAGAKDKGLIVCTWPRAGRPPSVMLYSDEVWTGIEYEVASLLIYEGMIDEGLSVAKAARDRYDGVPRAPITRNPWCELECGGHYTRAMSSWSVLLALSGFYCDGPKNKLRFAPRPNSGAFKSFFTTPEAWGSYSQDAKSARISIASGQFALETLELPFPNAGKISATFAGQPLALTIEPAGNSIQIRFQPPIHLDAGQVLELSSV